MADEACGGWMRPELSLGTELTLEQDRRAVPRMERQDLEARLDSALVELASCRKMFAALGLRA